MVRAGRALLAAGIFFLLTVTPVRAQTAAVRALLFYNPGFGDCKILINETLPPLLLQHDSNLLILTVDVTIPEGGALYESALEALAIPADQRGVPLLVVENIYLSGLASIKAQFPGMIDRNLSEGGTDWPAVPGLEDALQKAGFSRPPSNIWENLLADKFGNTLAVLVLAFLFFSLASSILITFRSAPSFLDSLPAWVFPGLLVIGLAVASYLTYTELTDSDVICGGISRCQEVHDSQYSRILGLITVGEFGIIGYCLLAATLFVHRIARGDIQKVAAIAMFGFAVFGVSFSIYLTFLEPFVIGATCLWCLASAVVMGLILPLTTNPVRTILKPYMQPGPGPASGG
ncbi:MAG: vitamin K epoxide reductase family protein [Anaerolineales bacterium]|nr:vitamin K epoxide reductase family protein [Anaerolineales bacterium]